MQYLSDGYFPIGAPDGGAGVWKGKIVCDSWPELVEQCRTRSLREVARRYGVSHEAVRRTIRKAHGLAGGKVR